ncbi:MAG: CHAT domain-containing tetratricopeptide repeat protein [Candidatus Bipolaricaulia bacterium]
MKRALRFAVVFICLMALIAVGVFAQGDDEKAWDDAILLLSEANAAYEQARFRDATDLFEEALGIARALDHRSSESNILNQLGRCYLSLSEYTRAIEYFALSLDAYRSVDNRAGEAGVLNNLGICFGGLADYDGATVYYRQSLLIFRDISSRSGEAMVLKNLGVCYKSIPDYPRAIEYFEQWLAVSRKIGSRDGEANSFNNLGNCYRSFSDYSQAIDCYDRALAIFRDIGDSAGEAGSLNNLGLCYEDVADYDRAIEYYEQSLAIFRDIGDSAGEAVVLNNLGSYYKSLSDAPRAIDYYKQSLALFREIDKLEGEANSYAGLGNCYLLVADYQRAGDSYRLAMAIFREIGDRAGVAEILNNLGLCHQVLLDYPEAIVQYEQALALSEELGTREVEQLSSLGLGRTYRAMGQPLAALSHYESAIEIVESIRNAVEEEQLRQSYFRSVRTLYEEYLELLLEMGRNEETILVAERLRARTFLDALYQSGLAPEQMHLNVVGVTESEDQAVPVMDAEALQLAVEEAQGSLLPNEAVLEYMIGDDGIYLWIVLTDRTLGPQFIPYEREQLLRDVVALRRAIEPQTKEVDGEPELFFDDPTDALKTFYGTLLKPALVQLDEKIDTLIFIPSGPLWYVPFAALVMTDRPEIRIGGSSVATETRPAYLVEEYTLAFLPSLASLPMLTEAETTSTGSYLAFANPTLSVEQQAAVGPHYQHGVLETACRKFASQVGGDKADVHVQAEASEALAHSTSTGQRVLMYACHGDFNPTVPLASRLLLAPCEETSTHSTDDRRLPDGDYHASEVLLTDHQGVDLVVLAACETLLPTLREIQGVLGLTLGPESDDELTLEQLELIVAGDEVVGLSRSFLSSGAHSVLGTLWQASAAAVAKLLVSLGEHHQTGLTWAGALCEAQRQLLVNDTFDNVWLWAPYQLIGRWR